ncbi:MAG: RNA polymerase sigma factor [Desulfatibacillaceae bacterium]
MHGQAHTKTLSSTGAGGDRKKARTRIAGLAERARSGDRTAFGELVAEFSRRIYLMAYYRTRSVADAEDIAQDTFTKAFTNIGRLKDPASFRSWLFSIAANQVRDHQRKQKVRRIITAGGRLFDSEDEPAPEPEGRIEPDALDHVLRDEFWKKVDQFSGNLSRWEKEIFTLRFMDELSIREIAEVTDKNENTVKTHLYRALAKFRKEKGLLSLLVAR